MTPLLHLPDSLRGQLLAQARMAYPRECCGLIEGLRDGSQFHALVLHPTLNPSPEPDRFEIDPAAHTALLRALRGTGRGVIGCYHSHPGGRPEPSSLDRQNGGAEGFIWLIAGISGPEGDLTLGAFTGEDFEPAGLSGAL